MYGIRNNVVFCGFDEIDKNSFYLTDIKDIEWESNVYYDDITPVFKHRFPRVLYVNDLNEALKHQGFAVFLKVDSSEIKKTKREIDFYYRSLFHKYDCIYLYNEKLSEKRLNKFSNIMFIGDDILCGELDDYVNHEYYTFINNRNLSNKNTSKVLDNVSKVGEYLKEKGCATSSEISDALNMNVRSIQRYMIILNNLYNCVGCDYYKNEWYYISPKYNV